MGRGLPLGHVAGLRPAWPAILLALAGTALSIAALAHGGRGAVLVPKLVVALLALAACLYDRRRSRLRRPLASPLRRRVGIGLGAAAMAAYYADARLGYPGFYHVHDQYHYFVGSKYFRELGYGGLYRCSAVALSQADSALDAEVRAPGVMLRDLEGGNDLMPAGEALADPARCIRRFTPERWDAFVADVRFFRLAAGARDWSQMLRDHGYNPPPLWTSAGGTLAGLRPASAGWLQLLGCIDLVLVAASFAALGWGFGWRAASLAAVVWGCQSLTLFYWTGGALLRQDWFFMLVLAACLARRGRYAGSGAALATAGLLRVFPLFVVIGWAAGALGGVIRRRRVDPAHLRLLAGGVLATAVLLPLSAASTGWRAYPDFWRHTVRQHAQTPLTNLVGLGVLTSYRPESGRMAATVDFSRPDPHAEWKAQRTARAERARPWTLLAMALGLSLLVAATWRRRPWVALSLAFVPAFLVAELTCYYYSMIALAAPLARLRCVIEPALLAFTALSLLPLLAFRWNDDRYAALSLLTGVLGAVVTTALTRRR